MRLKYRGAPKDWYIRRLACHHVLSRHKRIWNSDTRHCQRTRCIGLGGGSAYSPTWFGKLGSWQKLETRSTKAHRHGPDRIQTCCMISLTPGKSIIPGRPSSFEVSTMASSNRKVSRFEVGQRPIHGRLRRRIAHFKFVRIGDTTVFTQVIDSAHPMRIWFVVCKSLIWRELSEATHDSGYHRHRFLGISV